VLLFKTTFKGSILTCEALSQELYIAELRFSQKGNKDVIVKLQPNTIELNADLPKRIKTLLSQADNLKDLEYLLNKPVKK
jgi:hypothetical protein